MIPCTSKIPEFYCRETEISIAKGKHSFQGWWKIEEEIISRKGDIPLECFEPKGDLLQLLCELKGG